MPDNDNGAKTAQKAEIFVAAAKLDIDAVLIAEAERLIRLISEGGPKGEEIAIAATRYGAMAVCKSAQAVLRGSEAVEAYSPGTIQIGRLIAVLSASFRDSPKHAEQIMVNAVRIERAMKQDAGTKH